MMPNPKSFLLKEADAQSQYRLMIEEYSADNNVLDKGNALRSRFDIILNLALGVVPGKEKQLSGFQEKINRLLPGSEESERSLNLRLNRIRRVFNEKVQHRYNLEQGQKGKPKRSPFGWSDYYLCLQGVCDLIAYLSGVPIPPELRGASLALSANPGWHSTPLDVIVLAELFTGIKDIEEGLQIFKSYRRMLTKCRSLRLRVNFHLVSYSPALSEAYSGLGPAMSLTRYGDGHLQTAEALKRALAVLDESLERQEVLHGDKPWFLWLCRGLPTELDSGSVSRLEQLMAGKTISFYPIALRKDCVRAFESVWPTCGPYTLDSHLSANFFLSLLEGIQKLQSKSE